MNNDRLEGAAKSAGGKLEEGLGRAAGDVKMQLQGAANQAKGAAQDVYGHVREAAGEATTTVQRQARSLEGTIRENVETRPYTAVAVALALGWVIGRMGRSH